MKTLQITLAVAKNVCFSRSTAVFSRNKYHVPVMLVPNATCLRNSRREYSINRITNNIELISVDEVKIDKTAGWRIKHKSEGCRPMVVMLPWLLAQNKHILKYATFYMEQGFDVLKVSLTPWQLLWPVKGSQVIADDLLQFLHVNQVYQPLLLHGFSVGAYLWGEVLVRMKQDLELYRPIVNRIVGHIWDSGADITEIPVGFPKALFPNNPVLRNATEKYIRYHLRTFHQAATIHYIRSSQMFYTSIVRAPALLLISEADPIGCKESNMKLRDSWESVGIRTYVKCWEKSPHVGHFRKYPKEYISELNAYLEKLNLIQNPEKIRAKL